MTKQEIRPRSQMVGLSNLILFFSIFIIDFCDFFYKQLLYRSNILVNVYTMEYPQERLSIAVLGCGLSCPPHLAIEYLRLILNQASWAQLSSKVYSPVYVQAMQTQTTLACKSTPVFDSKNPSSVCKRLLAMKPTACKAQHTYMHGHKLSTEPTLLC